MRQSQSFEQCTLLNNFVGKEFTNLGPHQPYRGSTGSFIQQQVYNSVYPPAAQYCSRGICHRAHDHIVDTSLCVSLLQSYVVHARHARCCMLYFSLRIRRPFHHSPYTVHNNITFAIMPIAMCCVCAGRLAMQVTKGLLTITTHPAASRATTYTTHLHKTCLVLQLLPASCCSRQDHEVLGGASCPCALRAVNRQQLVCTCHGTRCHCGSRLVIAGVRSWM